MLKLWDSESNRIHYISAFAAMFWLLLLFLLLLKSNFTECNMWREIGVKTATCCNFTWIYQRNHAVPVHCTKPSSIFTLHLSDARDYLVFNTHLMSYYRVPSAQLILMPTELVSIQKSTNHFLLKLHEK